MFGFKQLITKPTRYDENNTTLIDIIVSNNSVHIPSTEVIPMSLSDHEMIGFTRKLNNKYTPQKINCRDYRNYDPERMHNELKGIDWNNMYEIKDVNKAWTYLQTNLSTTFDSHAPVISKIVKGKPSPWLTVAIKHQMNIRDQLYRKWKKKKSPINKRIYKDQRNLVNIMIHSAKNNYNKELLKENANDANKF